MKAEDTVMKKKWMNKQVQIDQDNLLLEQAEISFKAGIKEVVETINYKPGIYSFTVNPNLWQSKLKEWGI